MAKRIVIAGAGGFGRGVHSWITTSPGHLKEHNIKDVVFIDDGLSSPDTPVFSSIEAYEPLENDEVLCAIGNPKIRRDVTDSLTGRGSRFHTFVDDRAVLGSGVTVGKGSIICPGVVVSADASIGMLLNYCFLELDLEIMTATILETNTASRALFEKSGFRLDGVLRSRVFKGGKRVALTHYSLLRAEYDSR